MRSFSFAAGLFAAGTTIALFQNCSANFTGSVASPELSSTVALPVDVPVEPSGEPEPKSSLVNEHFGDASFENCFSVGPSLVQQTFVYKRVFVHELGKTVSLRAYVHRTSAVSDKATAIAMFHGGGWGVGEPTFWTGPAMYFASRGAVTVTFQYRLNSYHKTGVAEAVADARSAVRWMRKNAAALGIHPEKIVTMGDSAGGHLALSTALVSGAGDELGSDARLSSTPTAIAVVYPVVETVIPDVIDLPALSPTKLYKGSLPPTFIITGTADSQPLTPPNLTAKFCALTGCTLKFYEGREHAFLSHEVGTVQDARSYRAAVADFDDYLTGLHLLSIATGSAADRIAHAQPACRDHNDLISKQRAIDYGYDPLNYKNF